MTGRVLALAALVALVLAAAAAGVTPRAAVPPFEHVVVVVFENHELGEVIGSGRAPTFDRLAHRYALLERYDAVAHPSLPNYLALVSGTTSGITDDCTSCVVDARNLADTLEGAGRSWKVYAESLPGPGFLGSSSGLYAKKHNPFAYFRDVQTSAARRARMVPFTRFARDLAHVSLPDFSLVVPNLCNDMHDCSVQTGDAWLARFTQPLLRSPALRRSVVFVVFDEGTSDEGGGGRIPALVLGPLVRPHAVSTQPLTHYSLLRTIETAWHLPLLGRSRGAAPITGIWR